MAPRLKAANNAVTTLAESITADQTSFQVEDASPFPDGGPFRITMDGEVAEVGAIDKANNLFSEVIRGVEGTAAPHDAGTVVANRFTAGAHAELVDVREAKRTRIFASVLGL